MREKTVLIAELYKVVALVRTFNGERSPARGRCAVRTTQYTHDPTVTTRRRGGARITRCCRHRPGGGGRRGGYAREGLEKAVAVWAMVAAHGRPRAAGRVSAPGEEGGRRSGRRRRAERVGPDGVGEGGRRGLRIADTYLPGEEERRVRKWSSWEGACCAGAGAGVYGRGVRAGRGRGEERVCHERLPSGYSTAAAHK